jgi:hypothetical protein
MLYFLSRNIDASLKPSLLTLWKDIFKPGRIPVRSRLCIRSPYIPHDVNLQRVVIDCWAFVVQLVRPQQRYGWKKRVFDCAVDLERIDNQGASCSQFPPLSIVEATSSSRAKEEHDWLAKKGHAFRSQLKDFFASRN